MAAIVRIDFIRDELDAIRKRSRIVAKLLQQQLAAVERDPSSFEAMKIPPDRARAITGERKDLFVRKVKITHRKHDYRLVFLHQKSKDGQEQVDFLYARPRKDDYRSFDWDLVLATISDL